MTNDSALPADVLKALRAKRKIEAIKRLRKHRGLELKEAKQAIDAYVVAHSQAVGDRATSRGLGAWADAAHHRGARLPRPPPISVTGSRRRLVGQSRHMQAIASPGGRRPKSEPNSRQLAFGACLRI